MEASYIPVVQMSLTQWRSWHSNIIIPLKTDALAYPVPIYTWAENC